MKQIETVPVSHDVGFFVSLKIDGKECVLIPTPTYEAAEQLAADIDNAVLRNAPRVRVL